MGNRNRQVQVAAFGEPAEVAELAEGAIPEPGLGEVLVRTEFAPINPADLNVLEGRYGKLPDLPAVIGNEGAGRVAALGAEVEGLAEGDHVIYLGRNDCWQDYVVARADELLRVPGDLDPRAACMLKINPATAWLLLHQFGSPSAGGWVAQNASNSGVGRAVIAIAKAKGWRSINFVRRQELVPELQAAGADLVLVDDDGGKEGAVAALGEDKLGLAFNAVGGDSALRLMSLLGDGGVHITYGAMAKRPLKVPNGMLIFRDLQLRGLWLTRWMAAAAREEIETTYRELAELMRDGALAQPVDSTFAPDQIGDALRRALQAGREGKVLLDFRPARGDGKGDG